MACLALLFGLALYVPLVAHVRDWLHVGILHHSIRYEFETASAFRNLPRTFWQLGYIIVVISPLIDTSDRRYRIFGVSLLVAAGVTQAVYWYAFISVWCAFSAILSAWICYMLMAGVVGEARNPKLSQPARPIDP